MDRSEILNRADLFDQVPEPQSVVKFKRAIYEDTPQHSLSNVLDYGLAHQKRAFGIPQDSYFEMQLVFSD